MQRDTDIVGWITVKGRRIPLRKGKGNAKGSPSKNTVKALGKMSDDERKKYLDEAPVGTKIKGIFSKRSGNPIIAQKEGGYKAVYGGVGAGTRLHEENWRVSGSDDHYFDRTVKQISEGENKYYTKKNAKGVSALERRRWRR